MLKLFKHFKPIDWFFLVLSLGFVLCQVWLDLKMPDFMNEMTLEMNSDNGELPKVFRLGGQMAACAFGSLIACVGAAVLASKISANFASSLRESVFSKVQSFSMEEFGNFSTSSLITRTTNDITQIQMFFVMGLQVFMRAPITTVWAIIKISNKAWQWSFATGSAVLILVAIVLLCIVVALPQFKKLQKLTDDLNRVTRENLTGLKVVRAYNAEWFEQAKFEGANKPLAKANFYSHGVMSFLMPTIQIILSGLTLTVYMIGAFLISDASSQFEKGVLFADMIVYSAYAMQIIMSFMMLIMVLVMLPRAMISAKRLNEVLDVVPTIKDGDFDGKTTTHGEIEFKNVTFKYPDAEECVLEDISFSVKRGETIAIIGATGSGKSSIINLIPRFYDVTSGEILIDGLNVKKFKETALRDKISYVSQRATLFSGSVNSNVAFGIDTENFSEDAKNRVMTSVEIAQAKDFIEALDNGYNGFIAQGGNNLSGGQKQRISIARALYKNPEIIIFDDSFSALDYKTDKLLRQKLKEKCADVTKIIVAQRIGTIRDADKILVIEKGKIAGNGTHSELLSTCKVYQEIANSQLSKEELA